MWDRWLKRLPLPLKRKDFEAGYYPRLSIWQLEASLTQVFERPAAGREFFELVIRDNLDLGRPDRVQLVFDRKVNRRTPSRYRTRLIQHGVAPSLHAEYKHSDVKQYFKENRALRTETTVNDTRDFGINRGIKNFRRVRRVGEQVNRRLLRAEQLESGSAFAPDQLQALMQRTTTAEGRRAPALKFGDRRVMAVFSALGSFQHLVDGFTNAALRKPVASLLDVEPEQYRSPQMTYDLARLLGKGLIRSFRGRNRYLVTDRGRRVIASLLKVYRFLVRPSFPAWSARQLPLPLRSPLTDAFDALDRAFENMARDAGLKMVSQI
jgi:hypothetical protein